MAGSFSAASTRYLEVDNALGIGYPFSMGCWFYPTDDATQMALMSVTDKDFAARRHELQINGAVAGDPVRAITSNGGTSGIASTPTGFTLNTWHLAIARFVSATERSVSIDAGTRGTNATSVTPASIDRFSIGRRGNSTPDLYFTGRIAEAWVTVGYALTTTDEAKLYRAGPPIHGVGAKNVLGANLTHYWRILTGTDDPCPALIGGVDLANVSVGTADHVPIVWMPRQHAQYRQAGFA